MTGRGETGILAGMKRLLCLVVLAAACSKPQPEEATVKKEAPPPPAAAAPSLGEAPKAMLDKAHAAAAAADAHTARKDAEAATDE